jgi:Kef-type K+ transport system membrane component KefB
VLAGSLLHMVITVAFFTLLLNQFTGLDLKAVLMVSIALSLSSTVATAKVLESKREWSHWCPAAAVSNHSD